MPYCYVDLRSRKTGSTEKTILFTDNPDEAWEMVDKWNKANILNLDNNYEIESLIDGSEGLIADCFYSISRGLIEEIKRK